MDLISSEFSKPSNGDKTKYILTSAYTNLCLSETSADGIMYPSVPYMGDGYNLALKSDFVANNGLKLKSALKNTFIIRLEEQGNYDFEENGAVESIAIDYENRLIKWG
jgi:hypothetical protein